MKKALAKHPRTKGSVRKARGRSQDHDQGWNELEAQHDRLKTDWMSLAVQLGIGGPDNKGFD